MSVKRKSTIYSRIVAVALTAFLLVTVFVPGTTVYADDTMLPPGSTEATDIASGEEGNPNGDPSGLNEENPEQSGGDSTLMSGDEDDQGAGLAEDTGTPDTDWYTTNEYAMTYTISTADELAGLAELVNGGNSFVNKTINLGANIDLSPYGKNVLTWNNGKGWIPIGSFGGDFDGKGYTISGLYFNNDQIRYAGLFGYTMGSSLKNINVLDVDITNSSSNGYTGGIAGYSGWGSSNLSNITNCTSTGTIQATNYAGGIVGYSEVYNMANNYSACDVTGNFGAGGIAGTIFSGSISGVSTMKNCYSTGTVTGGSYAGGLIGYMRSSLVEGCYSTSIVNGEFVAGGLVGLMELTTGLSGSSSSLTFRNNAALNPSVSVSDSTTTFFGRITGNTVGSVGLSGNMAFGDMSVTRNGIGQSITSSLTGKDGLSKTKAELQEQSGFPALLTASPWTYATGKLPGLNGSTEDMPAYLSGAHIPGTPDTRWYEANPSATTFTISTADQLAGLAQLVNDGNTFAGKTINLGGNIDLSAYDENVVSGTGQYGSRGWTPIGKKLFELDDDNTAPFSGTFDGKGYEISNLYASSGNDVPYPSWGGPLGVFRYVKNGTIKNLGVVDVDLDTSNTGAGVGVGVIAFFIENTSITDCYTTGNVNGSAVGGIAGYAMGTKNNITDCWSSCEIGRVDNSTYSEVGSAGGILVRVMNPDSVTISNCYTTGDIAGGDSAGGIIGSINLLTIISVINNCYSTGNVTAVSNAGGIAGNINRGGIVRNCYATGDISTSGSSTNQSGTGGLVGSLYDGTLENSWSTGAISGPSAVGGLVGAAGYVGGSNSNVIIRNNAALNPSVVATESTTFVCRVTSLREGNALNVGVVLSGNIAFDGMTVTANGVPKYIINSATNVDGQSKVKEELWTKAGFPTQLTASPWTYAADKLPGLNDGTVDMPPHLSDSYIPGTPDKRWYEANPYALTYTISNADQLAGLSELVNSGNTFAGKTINLGNNIDLVSYGASWNDGKGWIPIGPYPWGGVGIKAFSGVFDGKGFEVSNLYIKYGDTRGGLFGYIENATIKNVGLVDVDIDTGGAGAFAASMRSGTITNCYSTGTVVSTIAGGIISYVEGTSSITNCWSSCNVTGSDDKGSGGIVGYIDGINNTISNCYTTGDITGWYNAGGIAGLMANTTMKNCYSTGDIDAGTGFNGGGLVGNFVGPGTVENCYATGAVSGAGYVGGLAGAAGDSNGSRSIIIRNSAALNSSVTATSSTTFIGRVTAIRDNNTGITMSGNIAFAGMTVTANGVAKTIVNDANGVDGLSKSVAELQVASAFPTPLIQYPWAYASGKLPGLSGNTVDMPTHLVDTHMTGKPDIRWYMANPEAAVFTITTADELAGLAQLVNGGIAFTNSTINLGANIDLASYGKDVATWNDGNGWVPIGKYSQTATEAKPFSGIFDGKGYEITNLYGYLTGQPTISLGLFGYVENGIVRNLGVTGVDINSSSTVGVIINYLKNGSISNCYSVGTVKGFEVGGIVAWVEGSNNNITNCWSSCEIEGSQYVGGIFAGGLNSASIFISNCHTTGDITASSNVGGIVGLFTNGTINNCFTTGNISANNDAGGIAGLLSRGAIRNCYTTGDVTLNASGSGTRAGGLVASLGDATLENSWSISAVSGKSNIGGLVGAAGIYNGTANPIIRNNAALNKSVVATDSTTYIGRIAAQMPPSTQNNNKLTLSGNVAFEGMTITANGVPKTIISSATSIDGLSRSKANLLAKPSFPATLTASPWTYVAGKLPGLNGSTVEMPVHLSLTGVEGTPDKSWYTANPNAKTFTIFNADELAGLAQLVKDGIKFSGVTINQSANIDLSSYGKNVDSWNDGNGWIPIGGAAMYGLNEFRGTFDGKGYSISGLYINNSKNYNSGLFGLVENGTLKNINVLDVEITGDSSNSPSAGGIVGRIDTGSITNCSSTGSVIGKNNAGGIVGHATNCNITNSFSTCDVTSKASVGGIAGFLSSSGSAKSKSIKNCYSTGVVTGGADYGSTGGIAGYMLYYIMENCYSTSVVTGKYGAGGLVGEMQGPYVLSGSSTPRTILKNSAALNPSVSGSEASTEFVGRVAGYSHGIIQLSGNYAYGGMTVTSQGAPKTISNKATSKDGLSKTGAQLQLKTGFPNQLVASPWTYAAGKLPGLSGRTVDMPHYLSSLPSYTADVSPAGRTFINAEIGYPAYQAQEFTIRNTGKENLTSLSAVLASGMGSDFEITSSLSANSLASTNATATVSVRPKTGLLAGTYSETLRITGNDGISFAIPLSFTVNEPVYLAAVAPTSWDFGEAEAGYSERDSKTFTITNTGTTGLSGLTASLANGSGSGFTAWSLSIASLLPGGSATAVVFPKTGLEPGIYSDELLVAGNNGVSLSIPVSFVVKAKAKQWDIVKGIDTFRFTNGSSSFFSSGTGKYTITGDYYEALLTAADTPSAKANLISYMNSSTWGGSCFGMSAVVALTKSGDLSPGFFQSGAKKTYDLTRPRDSAVTTNLVNYYQLMQLTPTTLQARSYYVNPSLNHQRIVMAMNQSSSPVMICFNLPGGGGHAIIGYDMTETASRYEIKIWDPNSLEAPSNILYISKDFSSAEFRTGSIGGNQYNPPTLKYALPVEDNSYDYQNIQSYLSGINGAAAVSDTGQTSIVTNYRDFTIAASSGARAVVSGGKKVSGNLNISDGDPLFNDIGATYLRFVVPTLSTGDYTVTPTGTLSSGTEFETSIYYDDVQDGYYSRAKAKAKGDYNFGSDGTVGIDFGANPQKATLELTLNETTSELFTASVTTTDTGLSLTPSSDADTIAEVEFDGNSSDNATVELSGDHSSLVFDDILTDMGYSITEDGGDVKIIDENDVEAASGTIAYSVSFMTNGGTAYSAVTVDAASVTKISNPGTPVKAGHTFGGWHTDEQCTILWNFENTITDSMTLYAKWTANKYAVTYNANSGAFVGGVNSGDKTIVRAETYGTDYAAGLGLPERTGYTFLGWNTAKDTKKGAWVFIVGETPTVSKILIASNHTVYAIWEPKAGAVFVNEGYGTKQDVYHAHISLGKKIGSVKKLSAPPAREGYTFAGWFLKDANGALKTKVTDNTKMGAKGLATLYAKWTPKKVAVTMNLNQKSTNSALKNTTKKVSVNYESSYAALAIPALAGELFIGWSTDVDGHNMISGPIATGVNAKGAPLPITIYAQYDPSKNASNVYTVKLDPMGGDISAASINVAYQKSPKLKYKELAYYQQKGINAPEREGYTFAGWYTAAKGGSKVTSTTNVSKFVNHTLYARWTANKYWVAYDLNGGKVGSKTTAPAKRFTYNTKMGTLPAAKMTGYVFQGWYRDVNDEKSKVTSASLLTDYGTWLVTGSDSTSTKVASASPTVILTAKFAPATYKATFNANGGNFGNSSVKTMKLSETYLGAYTLPSEPSRSGYIFKGWYTKKSGGIKIDSAKVELTKNTTLYAQWTKI